MTMRLAHSCPSHLLCPGAHRQILNAGCSGRMPHQAIHRQGEECSIQVAQVLAARVLLLLLLGHLSSIWTLWSCALSCISPNGYLEDVRTWTCCRLQSLDSIL